jgi:hypothetical protein
MIQPSIGDLRVLHPIADFFCPRTEMAAVVKVERLQQQATRRQENRRSP